MRQPKCYIEGVSTRENYKIFDQFGIESMSSTQVSNTNKKLDEEFEIWKNRDLWEFPNPIHNAGYEKLRLIGIVRDFVVHTAAGIDWQSNRRILCMSVEVKRSRTPLGEVSGVFGSSRTKQCRIYRFLQSS